MTTLLSLLIPAGKSYDGSNSSLCPPCLIVAAQVSKSIMYLKKPKNKQNKTPNKNPFRLIQRMNFHMVASAS